MTMGLAIDWAANPRDARTLAEFFTQNTSTAYISHGELQWGRADSLDRWSPSLSNIMADEISAILSMTPTSHDETRLLTARRHGTVLALAIVVFRATDAMRFGIIEDLVVDSGHRRQGIGAEVVRWIEIEAQQRGATHLFLESAESNEGAHCFFDNIGFAHASVIMMKTLSP